MTAKLFLTTKKIELINKREFAAIALDKIVEIFVVYITTLTAALTIQVHPLCQTQVGLLLANKAPVKVLPKYLDYVDVFLFDFVIELFKNTSINKHAIKLVESK